MQPNSIATPVPVRSLPVVACLLLALVGLADWAIWQVSTPRLSLVILAIAITAAAQRLAGPGAPLGRKAGLFGWGGLILSAAPLVEEVQVLSVLFLMAGMLHAAGWFAAGSTAPWAVAIRAGLRFIGAAIMRLFGDIYALGQSASGTRIGRAGLARLARDWALPLGLGGLFVLLFISANPLLDQWVLSLSNWSPDIAFDLFRISFWLLFGGLIWPFLRLPAIRPRLLSPARPLATVHLPEALLNPRSVLRALLTFNLIFALQTGLDLTYLWGGISLPQGMTYATYAHRGAYPLVVTALLAGGFALIAQPFLQGQPVLRGLLFLWTAQNILLVISSVLRLDLYVETYGLTRLRLAAFVWMGLVVAGLVLMVWQIMREKPVAWLFARAGLLGLTTLYLCCFINVAGLVAQVNLARSTLNYDSPYLCTLGPGAAPAIAAFEVRTGQTLCPYGRPTFVKAPQDLREWGYRNYRLRNTLAALAASTTVQPEIRITP